MSCMHVWRCSPNLLHWKDGPMKFWFRVPTIWFLNSLTRSQKFVWDSKKSPALMIWPIDDHRMVCGIGFATNFSSVQTSRTCFASAKGRQRRRWVPHRPQPERPNGATKVARHQPGNEVFVVGFATIGGWDYYHKHIYITIIIVVIIYIMVGIPNIFR